MEQEVRPRPTSLAIIGMSCLFPKSAGLEAYWATIRGGTDCITAVPATHWNPEDYFDPDPKSPDKTYARRGGFLDPVPFDPLAFGISPNNLEATDTSQLLGLYVARQALEDAGYGEGRAFDRDRVSVVLGVTGTLELVIPLGARLGHPHWRRALRESGVAPEQIESIVQRIAESYVPWQENSFPGLLGNVVAGRIANRLNLGGTNCVVDAACASSLSALHLAGLELNARRCDLVVTGGVDTFNDIFMYMCFSKTPALSPSGDARPFDAAGDGTILGEGIGMLVLKRLDDARRDGDRIYAVIRSVGTSSDGKGHAIYAPRSSGQQKALRAAYAQAGVEPSSIGLLEAHGTGTRVGDATELSALTEVFAAGRPELDPPRPWCAVGSVKSQIGHTKAAAGVAGLIKAALALHHKVLPPSLKVREPLEGFGSGRSPFYLNTESRPWLSNTQHPRRAGVSSFGFGGSNFHCLLEEAEPEQSVPDWTDTVHLLAWSAPSLPELEAVLAPFARPQDPAALRWQAGQTRARFDAGHPCRLALVLETSKAAELPVRIEEALRLIRERGGAAGWRLPEGTFFGQGPVAGALAFLFPGQGAQYVGMLRELALRFPEFRAVLAAAQGVFAQEREPGLPRLDELLYPSRRFAPEEAAENEARLRATEHAQPALGAASLGAVRVLERFGLKADCLAGHSFGELAALCVAGLIDEQAFHQLSKSRGALMAGPPGARGTMLAVQAPLERVAAVLAEAQCEAVIANHNAPTQFVLSGTVSAIEAAAACFQRHGIRCKPLAVSAAFHSPLVAAAEAPFLAAAGAVAWNGLAGPAGRPKVYANTTASPYPERIEEAQRLLAGQLARPVLFSQSIEALYAAGVRTFVEAGPGARLCGLVGAILGEREHAACALDASSGRRTGLGDLARLLAELAVRGHPLNLTQWDAQAAARPSAPPAKQALSIPICGANYRKPAAKRLGPPAQRPADSRWAGQRDAASAPPAPVAEAGSSRPGPAAKPLAPLAADPTRSSLRPGTPTPLSSEPLAMKTPGLSTVPTELSSAAPASLLNQALHASQANLALLKQIQEQTARLHQQFLEGQQNAIRTLQCLIQQQHELLRAPSAGAPGPVLAPRLDADRPVLVQALPESLPAAVSQERLEAGAERSLPSAPAAHAQSATGAKIAAAATTGRPGAVQSVEVPPPGGMDVERLLRQTVAAATGYPPEMIGLDMELDADLGIDSIKRVEILSLLQEKLPHAPAVQSDQVGALRTLRQIAEFLSQGAAAQGVPASIAVGLGEVTVHPAPEAPGGRPVAGSAGASQERVKVLLQTVAQATGYPEEMIGLDMELDADLGIDSIKRVEILSLLQERIPGAPAVQSEQLGGLRTLRMISELLEVPEAAGQAVPVAAQAAEPGAAVPVSSAAGGSSSAVIAEALLEVVAEKTGYPREMLALEMDLEADLGIDSIKRVEILSVLQERFPAAPAVQSEQLGGLRRLADVVAHLGGVQERLGLEGSGVAEVGDAAPGQPLLGIAAGQEGTILGAEGKSGAVGAGVLGGAESHGNGSGIRRLVLTRHALNGAAAPVVRLAMGGAIWLVGEGGGLGRRLAEALRVRGYEVGLYSVKDAVGSVPPELLSALLILGPTEGVGDEFLKDAFRVLRCCGPALRRAGKSGGALVATFSRLDGCFGLNGRNDLEAPESGGLSGLAKTVRHEWPEVTVKALDLAPALARREEAAVRGILEELFREGPLEVGLSPKGRFGLALEEAPLNGKSRPLPLDRQAVLLISGGARGITAEAAVALGGSFGCQLVLLGRSAAPELEPLWLKDLGSSREIRQALLERAQGRQTPRELEAACQRVLANREMLRNFERIAATGAQPHYRQLDVRDAAAVRATVEEIRMQVGPIRGVIHGAGVLADRLIEEKTDEQFSQVYDTKVVGLRSILEATAVDELRLLVLFSSSTGRYGRKGQVAYAVANEVLNKIAQQQARRRPGCRVLAVNWGPWNGGMVTPGLRRLFEAEGVGLIEPQAGAAYLTRELLAADGDPVEVTVLAGLNGHGKTAAEGAAVPATSEPPHSAERAVLKPQFPVAFERGLDLKRYAILGDHVLDGKAVFPAALMLEWLAHGALLGHPGLQFAGFDEFRVLKGVRLEAEQRLTLRAHAGAGRREGEGGMLKVPAELWSVDVAGVERPHARAEVLLAAQLTPAPRPEACPRLPVFDARGAGLYEERLFHGPRLQGIEEVLGCSEEGIEARVRCAPLASTWMREPPRFDWIADPLALDCAFQLLILWCQEQSAQASLPVGLLSYRQFARRFPAQGVLVRARALRREGPQVHADLDFVDSAGRLVARMKGYSCVMDAGLKEAFRRRVVCEA